LIGEVAEKNVCGDDDPPSIDEAEPAGLWLARALSHAGLSLLQRFGWSVPDFTD
jgi:hypothetical protein